MLELLHIETRRVNAASDSNEIVNDDADQGVVPDGEDEKLPELTPRDEEVDSNSKDEEGSNSDRDRDRDSD